MRTDISRIHEKSKYTEITPGNHVYGGGTSIITLPKHLTQVNGELLLPS